MKDETLAKIDLASCDFRGRVLDPLEPDQRIEEKYFAGWRNLLTASLGRLAAHRGSAMFSLIEDGGHTALEWSTTLPFLFVAGDDAWGDVEVRAEVRCIMTESFPYFHDEMTFDYRGRTGVAFHSQDSRRHYFAGFEAGQRVVIAVRENGNWIVLNSAPFSVDRNRWYKLALRCAGDRFEFGDDLHRAHFRRARDRASREERADHIRRAGDRGEVAFDLRDEVHHMGVAFDRHELRDAHGAGTRDAADIITQQVDEHQVLRLLLRIAREFAGPSEIRRFVGAARTRAGDRPRGDAAARDLDEEFRRTAGEGDAG